MKKTRIWIIGAVAALVVLIISWVLGTMLAKGGSDAWILRAGLSMLGLAAVGIVTRFAMQRQAAAGDAPTGATGPDDIDVTVAAAKDRLAAAKLAGRSSIGGLPLVLVLGPQGSAKTTSVTRSGLEADLLAGDAGSDVAPPTRAVNVWYAGGTIFVEAGGPLTGDQGRWGRLIRHLHPERMSAVFAGSAQAPRAAVICFSCEELTRPGNSEAVPAMARTLRARLGELSDALGIRLPVYVLFTKADRIPHFADYVQNFSREEIQQVLGATLTAELDAPAGSYADRESRRVSQAFQDIFLSLADKRLMVLSREHAAERRPGAYEFPRELRKIVPIATQFLVELCKPSQLGSSPFLRGFYFTGVQAVMVTETAPAAAAAHASQAPSAFDATSVFQMRQAPVAAPRAAAQAVTRKVPRWVFLDRVFRDVVLADRAALNVTGGGARVNILRRAALASVAAAAVLLAFMFTIPYFGNRGLQDRTASAVRGAAALPATTEPPPLDALQRLDTLREQVETLGEYQRDGSPVGLSFGLYSGDRIYPAARKAYFDSFDRVMFGATRTALVGSLGTLPDSARPTDDYEASYRLLKAYLITTARPDSSTVEFLAPVLASRWLGDRSLDSARTDLARRQFEFYSTELRSENPYAVTADEPAVARARQFLSTFKGTDRIYQTMVARALAANPPVQFRDPSSPPAVFDRYTVPGAFTKNGWTYVQGSLQRVGDLFKGEAWVLGPQTGPVVDTVKVGEELRSRYTQDYVRHWRAFLDSASIGRFDSPRDAAGKLRSLSGNQSPLLTLFALAANHTNVDTVTVAPPFKPVHIITPPGKTDPLIGGPNGPYFTALAELQAKIEAVANAPEGASDAPMADAMSSVSGARAATLTLAQTFPRERTGTVVQSLMERPIVNVQTALQNTGPSAGALNARGRDLCDQYNAMMQKFPFRPGETTDVSFLDLAAFFQPGSGTLARFYTDVLQKWVQPQGEGFVQRPNTNVRINPAFLTFFGQASTISRGFFDGSGGQPSMTFTFKPMLTQPINGATLTLDGQPTVFARNSAEAKNFVWKGPASLDARLTVRIDNKDVEVASARGPWALFRVLQENEAWRPTGGGLHTVEFRVPGNTAKLTTELNLGARAPVMRDGYYSPIRCVSEVIR